MKPVSPRHALAALLLLLGACGRSPVPEEAGAGGTPFTADVECDGASATRKNAYFGDMHVHTLYSVDAYFFNGLNAPREAYRFAKGEPESLPAGETDPYTAGRTIQLDRPLDFAAVTDHSDFLGDWRLLCQVDGSLPIGINPEVRAQIEAMTPLGRAGTPEEAAGAVYLFCTPESDFISGQTVMCAGGLTL